MRNLHSTGVLTVRRWQNNYLLLIIVYRNITIEYGNKYNDWAGWYDGCQGRPHNTTKTHLFSPLVPDKVLAKALTSAKVRIPAGLLTDPPEHK